MTELPRKAAVRTARLAALPLGYAGRSALGLGKRLGGRSAESVLTEVQQRTAEQLFRTLGELKGGAMKFGQALSVLEAALPDELVAPYREHLTALQDSAPSMPAAMAYEEIEDALGPDWRDLLVQMDEKAAAAASIGQVHRGRWHDGREVAVKVQYPGAGDALLGDLRQIARVAKGMAPVFPGIDIKPLVAGGPGPRGRRARLPPRGRGPGGVRRGLPRRPRDRGARRRRGRRHRAGQRVDGVERLAGLDHREGHPRGARPLRPAAGPVPVRRPRAHRHAARRPAPRELPDPAERRRQPGPAGRARLRRRGPPPRPVAAARAGPADAAGRQRRPRPPAGGAAPRGLRQGQDPGRPAGGAGLPRAVRRAGPGRARSASTASGCASSSSASTTRAPRRTPSRPGSTCRPRTSSSTARGSAASACSASSRPRRRSARSSRSRCRGSPSAT